MFALKTVLLHKASSAKSSDTYLQKFWWLYKKQYQTIVELNTVRGTVPSHSFAAAILILPDRGQRETHFECGRCLMLQYIFRGRGQ